MGALETLVLNEEACMDIFGQEHVLEHEMNTINMILFVKDRFHISGQAYRELLHPTEILSLTGRVSSESK